LLVAREASLASEEDGAGRWSVDHLFLDQDAVPTIVEVKRTTDTRIRREVVGQMLDYAANGVVYWSVDELRAQFEANPESEQDTSDLLEDPDADPEEFWRKVKTNLQAGKARLIFVSDEIPDELRRIVEFLNGQMDPAEVLAVEIKQYTSQDSGFRTLVTRVVGQTVEAQQKKMGAVRERRQWDESSFFKELETRRDVKEAAIARGILDWAKKCMPSIYWGRGRVNGVFIPGLSHDTIWHQAIGVATNGSIEVQFQYMSGKLPFDDEVRRLDMLRRLNGIGGIDIPEYKVGLRPSFFLSALHQEADLRDFLKVLDWFVQEVRRP